MLKYISQLILMISLLFSFFTSCAGKKIIVRNADTLISYQTNKQIPLNSAQKDDFSQDLKQFLNEQKSAAKKLLQYAESINLEKETEVIGNYHELSQVYDAIVQNFQNLTAKYMTELDSKQQKNFFEIQKKENKQIAKQNPTERLEKFKDRFRTIFGSLTPEQKKLFAEYQGLIKTKIKERVEKRKALQEELKFIFDRDISSKKRTELIVEALQKHHSKTIDHQKNIEFIKSFFPTLTKSQKSYFQNKLSEAKEMLIYFIEAKY